MLMLVVVRGGGVPTAITVAILDIEEGWRDVVGALGESAHRVLGGGLDDAERFCL